MLFSNPFLWQVFKYITYIQKRIKIKQEDAQSYDTDLSWTEANQISTTLIAVLIIHL